MISNSNHKIRGVLAGGALLAIVVGCNSPQQPPQAAALFDRDLKNSSAYTNALAGDLEFLPILPHRGEKLELPQDIAIVSIAANGSSAATRSSGAITLFVTSGIGVLTSQAGVVNLIPGKAVYIPAGIIFTLSNTSAEPVRFFQIITPSNAEVEYLPEAGK